MSTASKISTLDCLKTLGFVEERQLSIGGEPRLHFNFGTFRLEANRFYNVWGEPYVNLGGNLITGRTFAFLDLDMPDELDSVPHAAAWVAWCIGNPTGDFGDLRVVPPWLPQGWEDRDLLPWFQVVEYPKYPRCDVQRDWARIALKALAAQVKTVDAETPVLLRFNCGVLTIRCEKQLLAMPAEGESWPASYVLKAEQLRRLPFRLMSPEIRFMVAPNSWTGEAQTLTIGPHGFGSVVATDDAKESVQSSKSPSETSEESISEKPTSAFRV